ncbi:HlyD family secretion protein [Bacteroidales bacterium OttesenSCG-928-K22]|nr:HlyD family secretion protein [Bacteroidales bacterium OttesenSCG-928-L14]MDL2240207.1 HlyD family secretion protein [Bacteroidales bacterium OttesenSCG-928-K22]
MLRFETQENIELRSEEIKEILGRPPKWIVRWGISLIFIIIAVLFIGSYFFKYPDVLQATITVTTENLPAGITAKSSGRIDTIFTNEKQFVKQNDILAIVENPARFEDILLLKNYLQLYIVGDETHEQEVPVNLHLDNIQQSYLLFLRAHEDYQYFLSTDYHRKKIKGIKKQIAKQKSIMLKTENQLKFTSQQLNSVQQMFSADSALYEKKMLSRTEYENSKNTYIQYLQSYESALLNIDNQHLSILQYEQSIFDLEQQYIEQKNNLQLTLSTSYDQLLAQIKSWEQTYILVSPCDGVATFTKYWKKNQNINAGEILVTVVPQETSQIVGKILLPPQGAGKVQEGQMVNVKFDNFPYMEYGMIRVPIKHISLVPITSNDQSKMYILEVVFPEKLITNYGKELTFSQEMTGIAEIITEDLRLLDKFINPIKAVLKK